MQNSYTTTFTLRQVKRKIITIMTYYKPFKNARCLLITSCVGRLQISDNHLKLSSFVNLDSFVCFCFLKLIISVITWHVVCVSRVRACVFSCVCMRVCSCVYSCVRDVEKGIQTYDKTQHDTFWRQTPFQATKQHLNNS